MFSSSYPGPGLQVIFEQINIYGIAAALCVGTPEIDSCKFHRIKVFRLLTFSSG